jgi:hypothetical protein
MNGNIKGHVKAPLAAIDRRLQSVLGDIDSKRCQNFERPNYVRSVFTKTLCRTPHTDL